MRRDTPPRASPSAREALASVEKSLGEYGSRLAAADKSAIETAIADLKSALAAIDEIEEQGEGATPKDVWDGDRDMFHPDVEEVAHFFRYQELLLGKPYQRGDTPKSGPTGRPFTIRPPPIPVPTVM